MGGINYIIEAVWGYIIEAVWGVYNRGCVGGI